MEGYIKLEVKNEGKGQRISGEVHLEHVSIIDKVSLFDSIAEALHMDNSELVAVALTVPEFRKSCKSERVTFDPRVFGGLGQQPEDDSDDGDEFSFDYSEDEDN